MSDPLSIGFLYLILHTATSMSLRLFATQGTDEVADILLAGAGGNFYYDLLKKGGRKATALLVNRMKAEDTAQQPTNQHVQKALRKAQLNATLLALQSCWEELKATDQTFIDRFMRPVKDRLFRSNEEKQLVEIRKWLLESLREVERANYLPPQQADYDQIIMLADPLKANPAQAELEGFIDKLKQRAIQELETWHPSMPVLADKINYGWDKSIRDRDLSIKTRETVHFDWFNLVYEYFSEEYKRGGEVAHALNRLLFYQIRDDLRELPAKILTGCFDEIKGNLLDYFQRMEDKQDEILREVHRQPFYVRWQGKYEAEKVEQCLLENSQLLVGRNEELAALDQFVANNPDRRGYYLVKAGPGFGKTSLLASWVRRRRFEGRFIAYHFFSQRHDTIDVNKGLRNLLRQLCVYYEISDETLPPNEDSRDTIYGLIERRNAQADEPLVLVFDALDEAEKAFFPPFPPLPEGVFIIVSVRAEEKDTGSPYLSDWREIKAEHTRTLVGLDATAIKDWLEHERLRQKEKLTLQQMADDEVLAVKLHEKTEGFSLYLSYLIPALVENTKGIADEAQRRKVALQLIDETPLGFSRYLLEQYRKLCGHITDGELLRSIGLLFSYLSVTLGALSDYDVRKLAGLKREIINHLLSQHQARRWLRWRNDENNRDLLFFDHPLIQKEFAGTIFEEEADEALAGLLNYCRHWQAHPKSRYALRYYAEHLLLTKRWDDLFALARDEEFLTAQMNAFPKEPDFSLKTLQTVLKGAMEKDDAGAMAEFTLQHAERAMMIEAESPLDALDSGGLERAMRLTELRFIRDKERGVLWYLYLAWKLKRMGREDEARKVLLSLSSRDVARLTNWTFETFAAIALAALCETDSESFFTLQQRLLSNPSRHDMLLLLLGLGDKRWAQVMING